MGIQLDWQIQAEQTRQRDQEDPESRRRRRRERRRLVMAVFFVAAIVCIAASAIVWRLRAVKQREEDNLRAAVEAEYAAIRIGDVSAFMNVQRSASQPWMEGRRASFDEYQNLKQAGRFSAQIEIVDLTIDEERARVVVQEQIDGVTYQQVWFYWQYEAQDEADLQAGWRHVPPDVTFWGEEKNIENAHSSVTYAELDGTIATALADEVDEWWLSGCELLNCTIPNLELIIDPEAGIRMAWEPDTGFRLRVISPYLNGRVPVNQPIPPTFEAEIATMLAQRLITHASESRLQFTADNGLIAFDTQWVKYQLNDWLVGRFLGRGQPFIESAVQVFGPTVPADIARTITESGQINQLAPVFNPNAASLAEIDVVQLNQLDWRDFFNWRLRLERERLLSEDFDNFFAVYHTGNFNEVAQSRAYDPIYRSSPPETVQSVILNIRDDGSLAAQVDVVDSNGTPAQIQWLWNGDTFLREG